MAASNGTYIVDASVLIKWAGKEAEDLNQSEALRIDYKNGVSEIIVLALTLWELGNYLGREFDEKTASSVFNHFQNYGFRQALLSLEISHSAFEIMRKCPGVTFYDASYHALALNKGGTFLTADKKYYEKTKNLGNTMLLKDYS
jgi:predicted nucleic acid-binding protein